MSKDILDKIILKAKEYGARKLYLFGSSAESETFRDIDVACSGIRGWNLFRFAGELENELGFNIDIVNIDKESDFVKRIKLGMKLIYES